MSFVAPQPQHIGSQRTEPQRIDAQRIEPQRIEAQRIGSNPSGRARCLEQTDVFQHPLLEDPPTSSAPAAARRTYASLEQQAAETCRSCPLRAQCLYDAVARHDVTGYAGGTTERERQRIRTVLGVRVEPENLDTLAGVIGGNRPVDHDEVVRLRASHPDESLERLAQRLGCSLSTVKRHLRRERNGGAAARTATAAAMPTMGAVIAATRTVLHRERASTTAAA